MTRASEDLVGVALVRCVTRCWSPPIGFDLDNDFVLNSRPKHIRAVIESSPKRPRTDISTSTIEHRGDLTVPIDDVAGAVRDLIREGEVPRFDLSVASAATIRRAHPARPVTADGALLHGARPGSYQRPGRLRGTRL